jgi:hypothetical protein
MANRYEQFKGITQARNSFIQKMTRLFGKQAGRLAREIRATTNDKDFPDIEEVNISSFFDQVREEYKDLIRVQTRKIYIDSAIAHGMPEDLANQRAREFAEQRADIASRQITGSAFDRFTNLAQRLDKRIEQNKETSFNELRNEIKKVFNPVRGENIAINEATIAASEGALKGAKDSKLDSRKDKWKTNPHLSRTGPCPICKPLNNKTRRVWEKKFPNGPPAHIRCVCSIEFANKRKIAIRSRKLARAG